MHEVLGKVSSHHYVCPLRGGGDAFFNFLNDFESELI